MGKNETYNCVKITREIKAGESTEKETFHYESKEYGKDATIKLVGADTAKALGMPMSVHDCVDIKTGKIEEQSELDIE